MKRILLCLAACLMAVAGQMKAQALVPDTLWTSNGQRHIFGLLSHPTAAKHGIAIVCHGFNGTHAFGVAYFDMLAAEGYACYTFDFPCGSVRSRSDNHTMNMSVLDEVGDVEAIVRHFRAQPDVDTARIVLIGESQGGLVAALAAARLRGQIRALVLDYPALCIPDNWRDRYPEGAVIPDTTRMWNVPLGRRYFEEVRRMDVFPMIQPYAGPVLLVHGDADKVVPVDYSRRAAATYRRARLHVIAGAGHGFRGAAQTEAIAQIRAFLAEVAK